MFFTSPRFGTFLKFPEVLAPQPSHPLSSGPTRPKAPSSRRRASAAPKRLKRSSASASWSERRREKEDLRSETKGERGAGAGGGLVVWGMGKGLVWGEGRGGVGGGGGAHLFFMEPDVWGRGPGLEHFPVKGTGSLSGSMLGCAAKEKSTAKKKIHPPPTLYMAWNSAKEKMMLARTL